MNNATQAVKQAGDTARVAAFFDIDGTLVPPPSLERRLFRALRFRHAIPATNYLFWLVQGARLVRQGFTAITQANKMYLRGVSADTAAAASAPAPCFFPPAIARVAWHARQGHAIVLVSGTPAPLAHQAAVALTLRLAARGVTVSVGVCATRLEQESGRWTGQIRGQAMFGEAKVHAIRRIAADHGLDLARSYAYGDRASDRWMLAAVGRPVAVNPSSDLERIARLNDWPVLLWNNAAPANYRATEPEFAGVANTNTETLG